MSVLDGLRRACDVNPTGVATIDGDRRRTWTEFRDRIARLAGVLRAAGIQRGDRVAILSLNRTITSNSPLRLLVDGSRSLRVERCSLLVANSFTLHSARPTSTGENNRNDRLC